MQHKGRIPDVPEHKKLVKEPMQAIDSKSAAMIKKFSIPEEAAELTVRGHRDCMHSGKNTREYFPHL
jgi:hypothetical protein